MFGECLAVFEGVAGGEDWVFLLVCLRSGMGWGVPFLGQSVLLDVRHEEFLVSVLAMFWTRGEGSLAAKLSSYRKYS